MSKNKQQENIRGDLELVFVDMATPNYQRLLDDVLASNNKHTFKVLTFDGSDDGIERISSALSQYQNIDAIHIISRGADNSLILGSTRVDLQYLNKFSGIFSSWSDAFSAKACMRLYGGDVSSSVSDRDFLRTLARLTGTDVATSVDAIEPLGADWSFTYQTAVIEKSLAHSNLELS